MRCVNGVYVIQYFNVAPIAPNRIDIRNGIEGALVTIV